MGTARLIGAIREFANQVLGRGDATITVPSFDGALKPNQKLEKAELLLECAAPEDLATDGANLYLADGPMLLRLERDAATEIRAFDRPISALACMAGGALAVALGGREARVYADPSASKPRAVFASGLNAVNALAATPDGMLIATDGSQTRGVDQWSTDLLDRGRSGRVLLLDPATGSVKTVASGLSYAFGAAARRDAGQRELAASGRCDGARRIDHRRSPSSSGLPIAAFAGRRRRVLADSLCRAQPSC
jgi:hypothetical protein